MKGKNLQRIDSIRKKRGLALLIGLALLTLSGQQVYADEAEQTTEGTSVRQYGLILPATVPVDDVLPEESGLVGASLETSYDAREDGIVPEIRDQGSTGLCWSYTTLACMEINLVKNGLATDDIDLSEQHLGFYSYYSAPDPLGNSGSSSSTCTYYQGYEMAGGTQYIAALALMNWKGVVDDTGIFSRTLSKSCAKSTEYAYEMDSFHMGNWYQIPTSDVDTLKAAVKEYGAVSIDYYSTEYQPYFDTTTASYYYPYSNQTQNHAVTIIGWDDNYSKNNFGINPGSNGAWLVRNSWGTDWGDEGYFWLSYEDASIYEWAYAYEAAEVTEYDNNYQYDHATYGTYVDAVGAANVFTAKANGDKLERLEAVGIELGGSETAYSLQIYRNPTDSSDPTSGQALLAEPQTGTTGYAGFYVIPLDEAVTLSPGDTFAVVFDLSRESGSGAVGAEASYKDYYFNSCYDIESGQSYLAVSAGQWQDLSSSYSVTGTGNLKIKAYTTNTDTEAVACESITVSAPQTVIGIGNTVTCSVAYTPDNDAVSKALTWRSSDTSVAVVDSNGTVTGVSAGTATITAAAQKGSASDSVEITVVQAARAVSFTYNTNYYYVGETYPAVVTVTPANADLSTLTWTSSDQSVATVDSSGTLTVLKAGYVTVTAAAPNGSSCSKGFYTLPKAGTSVDTSADDSSSDDSASAADAETEQLVMNFVYRMYRVALNREPDGSGLEDWTTQLLDHTIDGAGIAHGFIGSEEMEKRGLSNENFVDMLYRTFFDREPDAGGRADWLSKLYSGKSRGYVLAGFVNSAEFDALCGEYGIVRGIMREDGSPVDVGVRQFVERCYEKVLGREGEETGVDDWTSRIAFGQMTAEAVAKEFFFSQEYLEKNTNNADFVESLYETFMGRASDAAGKAYWLNRLGKDASRKDVLEGFSRSEEFAAILASYGL